MLLILFRHFSFGVIYSPYGSKGLRGFQMEQSLSRSRLMGSRLAVVIVVKSVVRLPIISEPLCFPFPRHEEVYCGVYSFYTNEWLVGNDTIIGRRQQPQLNSKFK